jgi:hypothetical protein
MAERLSHTEVDAGSSPAQATIPLFIKQNTTMAMNIKQTEEAIRVHFDFRAKYESQLEVAYSSGSQALIDKLETQIAYIDDAIDKLEAHLDELEAVEFQYASEEEVSGIRHYDEAELIQDLFAVMDDRKRREIEGTLSQQNPRVETEEEYASWLRALFADYGYKKTSLSDKELIDFAEELYNDESPRRARLAKRGQNEAPRQRN